MIVVAALGVLVTPYLLPEPSGPYESASWSVVNCTRFAMATKLVTAAGTNKLGSRLAEAVANIATTIVEIIEWKIREATAGAKAAGPVHGGINMLTPAEGWVNKKQASEHFNVSPRTFLDKGLRFLAQPEAIRRFPQGLEDYGPALFHPPCQFQAPNRRG